MGSTGGGREPGGGDGGGDPAVGGTRARGAEAGVTGVVIGLAFVVVCGGLCYLLLTATDAYDALIEEDDDV